MFTLPKAKNIIHWLIVSRALMKSWLHQRPVFSGDSFIGGPWGVETSIPFQFLDGGESLHVTKQKAGLDGCHERNQKYFWFGRL